MTVRRTLSEKSERSRILDAKATHRFANIDALRAVAALLVLWSHAAENFVLPGASAGGAWLNDISDRLDFGRTGVVIFFCVSGYVIPATLTGAGWLPARRFLISRLFRLFPLFWLSIPAGLLFGFHLLGKTMPARDIVLNLTMVPELLGAVPVQGLYWTLEVELIFYGLCLALHFAGSLQNRATIRLLCFGLLALMALFALHQALHLNFGIGLKLGIMFGNLSLMFFGSLCRKLTDGALSRPGDIRWIAAYAALWLTVLPVAGVAMGAIEPPVLFPNVFVPYSLGLLVFLAGAFLFRSAPRWLAWLGCISYSLYLLQAPVIWAMLEVQAAAGPEHPMLSRQHLAIYIAIAALAAILVSWASYVWIELPAIALGRRAAGKELDAARAPGQAGA